MRQQCAVDLCGPVKENPGYIYNNFSFDKANIDPEIAEQFNEKVRPFLEKAIQDRLNYENNILNPLKETLKNPNDNIKPEEWDKIAEHLYDSYRPATPHSETLLRAITEAIHKRIELPQSCQQVVDIYSDRINFEPCF